MLQPRPTVPQTSPPGSQPQVTGQAGSWCPHPLCFSPASFAVCLQVTGLPLGSSSTALQRSLTALHHNPNVLQTSPTVLQCNPTVLQHSPTGLQPSPPGSQSPGRRTPSWSPHPLSSCPCGLRHTHHHWPANMQQHTECFQAAQLPPCSVDLGRLPIVKHMCMPPTPGGGGALLPPWLRLSTQLL